MRRESPIRRVNPGGGTVWVARWRDKTGKQRYGMPPDIPGTHKLKRDAQDAIDAAHELDERGPARVDTLGAYAESWTTLHPRMASSNRANDSRLRAVLDVEVEGVPLREWRFDQLRRRHANLLVDHLFRVDGRAQSGALAIIRTLSALTEDAINDDVAILNPFKGVRVSATDPRIRTPRRPVRVWSWQEMHAFARACAGPHGAGPVLAAWRAVYAEPMIRVLSDCGLRIGEVLPLERGDLDVRAATLQVRRSAYRGVVTAGTKTDHGEVGAGRVVPVPPGLLELLAGMPRRIGTRLLFPTPSGGLWWYSNWLTEVWAPGRVMAGVDPRPHEFRHSMVSLLRAAGVDAADLADVSGHSVETATANYTHGLGRSFEAIREAVGQ